MNPGGPTVICSKSLLSAASIRADYTPFQSADTQGPCATVHWVLSPGPSHQLLVDGDTFTVLSPDEPFALNAALREVWHVLVTRQGGFLMHASAVAWGDRALLATGPSGDGKSTTAELCLKASAQLLSDEIVAVYPDGRCHGTPFRSSLVHPGNGEWKKLALAVTLRKGDHEALEPLSPSAFIAAVMAQVFRPPGGSLSDAEALRRVGAAFSHAPFARLTFRKDPDAGRFLRAQVASP